VKTRLVEYRATPVDPVSCYENHEPVNLNELFDRRSSQPTLQGNSFATWKS